MLQKGEAPNWEYLGPKSKYKNRRKSLNTAQEAISLHSCGLQVPTRKRPEPKGCMALEFLGLGLQDF